ncbi:Pre-rRNA-processing protein TSR2 [Nymphon striatum]|nr:Pre-rRNA-processing protein TSR2 [Nymphon striatum]
MDGREKEQFMAEGVVEYFQKNDNLYCDEVEDLIDYMLEYEFNSRPEDGSTSEIAKLFCECADLISKGKENEAIAKLPHSISLPETNSAIESSICSNPETAPPLEEMNNLTVDESENSQQNSRNTPDEDGWTFVRKKK